MRKTTYALVGLVITLLVIAAFIFFRPQIASLFAAAPPCGQNSLTLGEITYPIQIVNEPPASAPKTLPAVLMLTGSEAAPVIWLYDSRSLDLLKPGLPAVITWANCNTATYLLQEPQSQPATDTSLTLIVEGVTLLASLQQAEISTFPSPAPSSLLLEASLLETQIKTETVTVHLEIVNYGQQSVRVTSQNISLGGIPPQTSQPPLPQEITPGASISLAITFARLPILPAELRIFDTAYEINE